MRASLLLLVGISLMCQAQVKEVNFFGKSWYLHGYDFRIKGRGYGHDFYRQLAKQSTYPDQAYSNDVSKAYQYKNTSVPSELNTISAGLVFRPFYHSKLKLIKQFELCHNIELERINTIADAEYKYLGGGGKMLFRMFEVGYNPRFLISSPTIAEYLKLYATADGYAFIPVSGYVYNQIDESFLLNGGGNYTKNKRNYNDRLGTNHFKYGGGLSIGIKMNIDCNWNFHIEGNAFDVYTRHNATRQITNSGNIGVQFGLRYKFGIPGDTDTTINNNSAFW